MSGSNDDFSVPATASCGLDLAEYALPSGAVRSIAVAAVGARFGNQSSSESMSSDSFQKSSQKRRFAFVSTNQGWGGSEILWSEAADRLASDGHSVSVYKNRLPEGVGALDRLRRQAATVMELSKYPLIPARLTYYLEAILPIPVRALQGIRLYLNLRFRPQPDLVIIAQGGNLDGWGQASICRRLNLPFVLICQKASELYWPQGRWLDQIRQTYKAAQHVYFVSEHNRRLTEEQIGLRLPRASVVRNPFLVPWNAPQPWPENADNADMVRLACVGRLYPKEKGQDILLRVLAMPKWRARPISLTLYGEGDQLRSLQGMVDLLELPNVTFAGQVTDVAGIWREHHLLLLPSRAEGLPLVVVEAMLSGRLPIVSDVAGNREMVEDGVSGFVADSPSEAAFDDALERAWQSRDRWPQMGLCAAAQARGKVPADPAKVFAELLCELVAGEVAGATACAAAIVQHQGAPDLPAEAAANSPSPAALI